MITLNAGCGNDKWGVVRIDKRPNVKPHVIGTILNLPFRSKMFHKIKLSHVLEHLRNPIKGLIELKMTLNGILYIEIPNIYHYIRILRTIKRGVNIPIDLKTLHLQLWDIITITQLLYQSGFDIIKIYWSLFNRNLMVIVR